MKYGARLITAAAIAAMSLFMTATGSGAAGIEAPAIGSLKAGEQARVIVVLSSQVDPNTVTKGVKGRSKGVRTRMLVKALKDNAELSQKNIMKLIKAYRAAGKASHVKSLWIIDAVALTAPREVIDELALQPEVAEVYPDAVIPLATPVLSSAPAEYNLSLINAPVMWDLGFSGQGVVVASMDSGVDYQHPDLAASYRGGTNSWFDPNGQHTTPYDSDGHGTETMGVMVGGSVSGSAIGVAPGAKWIAVKMFPDNGNANESDVHDGYQWLLDPDNNPATDDAPDIVNNSWGYDAPGYCAADFEPDIATLRAAGILPVYSAGNYGPYGYTDISPANNAGALSVGATDIYDNPQNYSSRGPNSCNDDIFPLMCAPGTNVYTSTLSSGGNPYYATVSGTSFSAPHVSGAAALLLSASPGLTVDQLEAALVNSSVDLPPTGPDDTTGAGRLDVLAAYNALSDPAAPGITLAGPVEGAQLWKKAFQTYTWQSALVNGFELQFSNLTDFSVYTALTPLPGSPSNNYTPDKKSWKKIKKLGKKGRIVYWRVKGTDMNNNEVYSDTRSFTIVKELPVP